MRSQNCFAIIVRAFALRCVTAARFTAAPTTTTIKTKITTG